ncbi:MAG: hypothetical protein GY811_06300 [Myxococcales bacterium]|nr:hypothetical protein [Myxococcales bacterium]
MVISRSYSRWVATASLWAVLGTSSVATAQDIPAPGSPKPPAAGDPNGPPGPEVPEFPQAPPPQAEAVPVPAEVLALPPEPVPAPVPELAPAAEEESQLVELRVHVMSTSNVFDDMKFDVFSVADKAVVGRGEGANEATGEAVASFEVERGLYKIVRAGESFDTNTDFATVSVEGDTDFLIVVDADSGSFRGSGPVTGELPTGVDIAGIRFALNVGGSLWMNQKANVVGGTNGVSALVGVFGNFGMVYDEGAHFLTVDAKLQLNLQDAPTSGVFASTDYLEASALYAYNINNPYVGPYARAGLKTRIFPGYLYLADESGATGQVSINRLDGNVDTYTFGSEAHPDDLRLEIAKPFAPFTLQEEIGANLRAVDLDLKLLELSLATRVGWAFRQGITNNLFVVDGDERGGNITLNEVDDYFTTGPLAGASANLTFARWLFGQAEIAALMPVQDRDRAGGSADKQILLDASGTAGLKFPALTSKLHASFDYTFRLQRDGFLTDVTMFDQIVMARVALQLF